MNRHRKIIEMRHVIEATVSEVNLIRERRAFNIQSSAPAVAN
jgi:hypothetical protein